MVERIIGLLCAIVLLGACNEGAEPTFDVPPSCTHAEAKVAASEVLVPIMLAIANPETRTEGCDQFDNYLRFSATTWADKKPNHCSWGIGRDDPEQMVEDFARGHEGTLSKLCDWPRRDMEARGRRILESFSPEDRQVLEDAYNGF